LVAARKSLIRSPDSASNGSSRRWHWRVARSTTSKPSVGSIEKTPSPHVRGRVSLREPQVQLSGGSRALGISISAASVGNKHASDLVAGRRDDDTKPGPRDPGRRHRPGRAGKQFFSSSSGKSGRAGLDYPGRRDALQRPTNLARKHIGAGFVG